MAGQKVYGLYWVAMEQFERWPLAESILTEMEYMRPYSWEKMSLHPAYLKQVALMALKLYGEVFPWVMQVFFDVINNNPSDNLTSQNVPLLATVNFVYGDLNLIV